MDKALRITCDAIAAILLALCIGSILTIVTLGSPSFYRSYYARDSVTKQIEAEITKRNDEIALSTGIEKGAFDYALEKEVIIDELKFLITPTVFNGVNNNYSQTQNLDDAYLKGINEYYRLNELEKDTDAIARSAELASDSFDDVMNVENPVRVASSVRLVTDNAKIIAVLSFVLLIVFVSRIFAMNFGRTKSFAHIASSMISAGASLVTAFVLNLILDFNSRLNITSNQIISGAIDYGIDKYFKILAIFGVVSIIIGLIAAKYVYDYYMKKHGLELEEKMIREKILDNDENDLKSVINKDTIEIGDNQNGTQ